MHFLFLLFALITIASTISFPEANLRCPEVMSLSGHTGAITEIRHIPNTAFYVSLDANNMMTVSDIRNGEIYQKDLFLTNEAGAQSLVPMTNADTLILSSNVINIYNVLQLKMQASFVIDNSLNQYFFSHAEVVMLADKITYIQSEYFIIVNSDAADICTQLVIMSTKYQYVFTWQFYIQVIKSSRQPIQPTLYFFAQGVYGIYGSVNPSNILLAFSTSGDMYAAQFPTYNFINDAIYAGTWKSQLLLCNVISYAHLPGTSLIAIQYGVTLGSGYPIGCISDYCLVFYDLKLLAYDGYSWTFILSNMIAKPTYVTQLNLSSYIQRIQISRLSGENYIQFLDITGAMFVYKLSEFVQNGCKIDNAKKVSFSNSQSVRRFASINIDQSMFILLGFSNGMVASVDFSGQISSLVNSATPVTISSFHFTQTFPGISSYITSISLLDSSTSNLYSLGTITSTSSQFLIPFTSYNIFTQTSQTIIFTFPYGLTKQFLILSPLLVFGVIQSTYSLYISKVSGSCPLSYDISTAITIHNYFIEIRSTQQPAQAPITTISSPIHLASLNLQLISFYEIIQFSLPSSTTTQQDQYVVISFLAQTFSYSNYCLVQDPNNQGSSSYPSPANRLLQASSYYLHLYISDISGNIIGKTTNSFLKLPSSTKTYSFTKFDNSSTLFVIFTTYFRVVHVSITSNPLAINLATFLDIPSYKFISVLSAYNPALISYGYFYFLEFLPGSSKLLIQFSDYYDTIIYTGIFSYSQNWWQSSPKDLQLVLLSLVSSTSDTSDNPYIISQALSWSTSSVMLRIKQYYKIYSISNDNKLSLLTTFKDKFTVTSSSSHMLTFLYAGVQQFLKVSPSQVLEKIIFWDCLTNKCQSQSCQFNFTLAQTPQTSSLSEIFSTSSSHVLHTRPEEFQVASQKLYQLLTTLPFTSINYMVNINSGDDVSFNSGYLDLQWYFDTTSLYSSYLHFTIICPSVNLQIQAVHLERGSNNEIIQILPSTNTANITVSSTFSYSNYWFIKLSNLLWNVNPTSFTALDNDIFQINNDYFIIENIQIAFLGSSVPSTYSFITVIQGESLQIFNCQIQNQNFTNAHAVFFIKVDGSYSIEFSNFSVKDSMFIDTTLLYSQSSLTLTISDSIITRNTIQTVNTASLLSSQFISSQFTTFNNVTFSENTFVDSSIQGLNLFSSNTAYTLNDTKYNSNIFISDSLQLTELIFNGKITSYLPIQSTFSMTNSTINSNSQKYCTYAKYLESACSSNDSNSLDEQLSYLLAFDYTSQIILNNIISMDNQLPLVNSVNTIEFTINTLTCGNTQKSTISDQSCIRISDFSSLAFTLSDSNFLNKTLYNTFLIDASSTLKSQGNSQTSIDGYFTMKNVNFSDISLTTENSFEKSSSVSLDTLKKIQITITEVNFNRIEFTSPQRLFNGQGSCLLMQAPFSYLSIESTSIQNLLTASPASSAYLNVKTASIASSSFLNNNFDLPTQSYQGGFLDILTNNLTIFKTTFNKSISEKGSAITISPSDSNAIYSFNLCSFNNLIAFSYGAAVYIPEALNSSSIVFEYCTFNEIATRYGGAVYLSFPIKSSDLSSYYSVFPNVTMNSCNSSHVYAAPGGLVYAKNAKISLVTIKSTQNNPSLIQKSNPQINTFLSQIPTIGAYIYAITSFLDCISLEISGHNVRGSSDFSSVVFLKADTSSVTIQDSIFSDNVFSNGGFLAASSSDITIEQTSFTSISYFQHQSSRFLTTDITASVVSAFSAIIFENSSTFTLNQAVFNNIQCLSSSCLGGALAILNSHGTINSSNFTKNFCQSNGGAIGILNLNGNSTISNGFITNNTSSNGNGGGLFVATNLYTNVLTIQNTAIESNIAQTGGGLFLESQEIPQDITTFAVISDSSVQYNTAEIIGGGIFYQGYAPQYTASTVVSNNNAKPSFGQNSFSYPNHLRFNAQLSMRESAFKFTSMTSSNSGQVKSITILNQISGATLPNLVFDLIDENNQVIDSSYPSIIGQPVTLNIAADTTTTPPFMISSASKQFTFSGFFNISGFVVIGTPGTTITLQLTSTSIDNASEQLPYVLDLQIELRSCIQGEIYKNFTYSENIFFECQKCSAGYFSLEKPILSKPIYECSKCPYGADCPGGSILDVNPGYWRINDQSSLIIPCSNAPQNCLGGTSNSTCATGHIGSLCESCDIERDFSITGDFQCGSCGNQAVNALKIIGIFICFILSAKLSVDSILKKLLNYYKIRKNMNSQDLEELEQNTSILMKLIMTYFQIIMVITTFQISVPTVFSVSFDAIASPTTQIVYSFECFFYLLQQSTGINRIYIQLFCSLLLPIICLIIFFISGSISYRQHSYNKSFYLKTSFLYSLIYFQPSIFKNAISLISCRKIGALSYIRYNILYECFTEEYYYSLAFVVPVALLVAVIIPARIAVLMLRSQRSFLTKKQYLFMTGEYHKKAWFWEFLKMFIKLSVMCCLIFFEYDIPNKILFIFFLVTFYGILLHYMQPYKHELFNKIDLIQTAVLAASVYLGFIAYLNTDKYWLRLSILLIIGGMNAVFIAWSFKMLIHGYTFSIKNSYDNFLMSLVRIKLCGRYCFTKKTRLFYLRKRWIRSVVDKFRMSNIINAWTGQSNGKKENILAMLNANDLQVKNEGQKEQSIKAIAIEINGNVSSKIRKASHCQIPALIEGSSPQLQALVNHDNHFLRSMESNGSLQNTIKAGSSNSNLVSYASPTNNPASSVENQNILIRTPARSNCINCTEIFPSSKRQDDKQDLIAFSDISLDFIKDNKEISSQGNNQDIVTIEIQKITQNE